MNKHVKSLLRPAYDVLVTKNPLMQQVIRRETANRFYQHIVDDFIGGDYGSAYGVTRAERAKFVADFEKVGQNVQSATSPLIHVVLARDLLSGVVDRETERVASELRRMQMRRGGHSRYSN